MKELVRNSEKPLKYILNVLNFIRRYECCNSNNSQGDFEVILVMRLSNLNGMS